jgi:hypothetical protein
MAHVLADFFAQPQAAPAKAAPARPSLLARALDALKAHQMRRVRREMAIHRHLFETLRTHGDAARVGLSKADILPFNR